MSTEPNKQAPAPSAGPQKLLLAGVVLILAALAAIVWLVATGKGAAPANNVAEAKAPAPTPGGGQLLPSGLRIEIIRPGTGALVQATDIVRFRYELRRYGGQVIESNLTAPTAAVMPVGGLVPGFQEGLTHMRPGGEARFWIPPQLGYGDSPPAAGIGPNDTLEFLVRVEGIGPATGAAAGNAAAAVPDEPANAANAAAEAPRRR